MQQTITWFKAQIGKPVTVKLPNSDELTTVTYYTKAGAEAHFDLQKKGFVYIVDNAS